ncbi:MAG: 2-hydroxychromene-2-carboxylate isomerase [Alphaproteobacteria bacterium]|nr:2-hydroxychromene-2-carboxylate isomerase [Alphaproteobacteria bacterium]
MARLEFFFDCSSPWTYLAFHRIEAVAAARRASLLWKPILVGGLFNTVNPSVYHSREHPVPAKQRYQAKDLADWARHCGLAITWVPGVFPVNSVKAMRGCVALAGDARLPAYARAVFELYWGEDRDISQDAVLAEAAARAGLDAAWLRSAAGAPAAKDGLRANTEELAARGGFGSPTMFVDGADMYFGNDRLPLVEAALARSSTATR